VRSGWRRVVHGRAISPARDDAAQVEASEAEAGQTPYPPDELAELLQDLRNLRMTLAMDLTAAASAIEQGADEVAGDVVDADRRELAKFTRGARERLSALQLGEVELANAAAAPIEAGRRSQAWRRRVLVSLPAVPLVGAVALSAAAAAGFVPVPGQSSHSPAHVTVQASAPVASTFHQFESVLDGEPSASQVITAASALHRQLAALLANARQNPSQVGEVAQLLQLEQALLLRKQPPGSNVVLAESRQLAAKLLQLATSSASPQSTTTPTYWAATPPPHHSHSAPASTPTAQPTSQPTKAPTPTAQPTKAASPTPSSSPSGYPTRLPNLGN